MARVDVISSCLVGTASNATPICRLELTPLDLQLLLLDPIQKGILFHKPPSTGIFQETIIDRLKDTLSRTLDVFPPLAGRLAAAKNDDGTATFFVDCNNAGVEFVHAVAEAVSISDILEPTYIPGIVSSLFPLNGVLNFEGVSKPLLGVQLTEFADGLFIACTANHVAVDGISFWHFFNSWSEISRGFETISKPPVFNRWFPSSIEERDRLVSLPPLEQQDQSQSFVPPPLLERVFYFSKETLAKIKAKANSEAGTDKISSLQALSAHLWWIVTRCRHSRRAVSIQEEEAGIMMLAGARARIPLPDGYFGNAVVAATTAAGAAELSQKGLGFAARKINELVAEQSKESIMKFVEDWVRNPILYKKGGFSFCITSSPRHNVYGSDFGWGKPVAVRSGKAQKVDGKMTMFPAAVAGGIDVEVCLAPETLQAMEDDTEFMEAFAV